MSSAPAPKITGPYPQGFVFGRGQADPAGLSLAGLKIRRALWALKPVNGKILELGCGGGQYLRAIKTHRPDLDVFGVDLDIYAVAEAVRIPGVTCCRADAARLPFAEQTFSAVVGFDILEHVAGPAQVLAEAWRVLAPNGRLHLYVPCEGNPGTVYMRHGHDVKARFGGHVQQFTLASLLDLVKAPGFKLLRVRPADYWLAQQADYAFFSRLAASRDPRQLWAAQSLQPGGGFTGAMLRCLRRTLSALTWLESVVRFGQSGSMGAHVTAVKEN
jgi:SAM-dependent methyltransferase